MKYKNVDIANNCIWFLNRCCYFTVHVSIKKQSHFSLTIFHMVRADQHVCYPSQLYNPGNVPAVQWQCVWFVEMPNSGEIWLLYLLILCCGNDNQDDSNGSLWKINISGWNLEQTGLFYCPRWVSTSRWFFKNFISLSFYLSLSPEHQCLNDAWMWWIATFSSDSCASVWDKGNIYACILFVSNTNSIHCLFSFVTSRNTIFMHQNW